MIKLVLRAALALPHPLRRIALLPLYRAAYATYNRHWGLNTAGMAEDYVYIAAGSRRVPGLPAHVTGRAGFIAVQKQLLEVLDVARVALDGIVPLDGQRVIVHSRFVIRAAGGEVDQHCLELHEFRRGALVRQTYWFDRDEGRRELGL